MARWELYFVVSTVLEIPCIFLLYATHYRSFNQKPNKLYFSLNENNTEEEDDYVPIVVLIVNLEISFQDEYRRRESNKVKSMVWSDAVSQNVGDQLS